MLIICRCLFCALKEGLGRPISVLEEPKPCPAAAKRFAAETDPTKVFVDSPVYREPKIRDEETYTEADVSPTRPFGELFQREKQFQLDVFEPEYPDPFCEKSFMQQHPLFGDFGVTTPKRADDGLQESPECPSVAALNDPESQHGGGELVESPEQVEPKSLDDPEGPQDTEAAQEEAKPEDDEAKLEDDEAKPEEDEANPEDDEAKPEEDRAEPEADEAKPEVNEAKPEDETKPEVDEAKPEDDEAKPEEDRAEPEADEAKPEDETKPGEDEANPEVNEAKPEDETKPEVDEGKPEVDEAKPEVDEATPQAETETQPPVEEA